MTDPWTPLRDQARTLAKSAKHRRAVVRRWRRTVGGVAGALCLALAALIGLLTSGKVGEATPTTLARHPTTTLPIQPTTTTAPPPVWRVAWGSPMAWGDGTAWDTTVRELTTVAISGEAVRVRISNLFGDQPLVVGAATVAQGRAGGSIVPGSAVPLTFGGQAGVTVAQGAVAYSDPAQMAVTGGEVLAVSVYVSGRDVVTVHPCCKGPPVSFATPNGIGDATMATNASAFSYQSAWPRWVDAVDVLQPPAPSSAEPPGSIVVVGDSITDGFNATMRWTDVLQQRIDLLPSAERRAVINEGITANTLTDLADDYSKIGGGLSGLDRLAHDAIDQSGVSTVVIFLGTNDLYFGATAGQVIAGLQQAANEIHQAGLRAVGVMLTPRMAGSEKWDATQQSYLEQINQWLSTSTVFDGVIDFAAAVADDYNGACIPTSMFPPYDSGDHLHPNAVGQAAMGDAVDGPALGLPALPQVPPLLAITPTPGCQGAPGLPAPA